MPISNLKQNMLNLSVIPFAGLLLYAAYKTGMFKYGYIGYLIGIATLIYYFCALSFLERGRDRYDLSSLLRLLDASVPIIGVSVIIAVVVTENFSLLILIFLLPLYYLKAERLLYGPRGHEIDPVFYPETFTCKDCGFSSRLPAQFHLSWEWKDILVIQCKKCEHKSLGDGPAMWFQIVSFGVLLGLNLVLTNTLVTFGWFLIWIGAASILSMPLSIANVFVHLVVSALTGAKVFKAEFGLGRKAFEFRVGGIEIQFNRVPCGGTIHSWLGSETSLDRKLAALLVTGPIFYIAVIAVLFPFITEDTALPFTGDGINLASTTLVVSAVSLYLSIRPVKEVLSGKRIESGWSRLLPIPEKLIGRPGVMMATTFSQLKMSGIIMGKPE